MTAEAACRLRRWASANSKPWTQAAIALPTAPNGATFMDMRTFTAIIERDAATGLFVGWIPGIVGAHSQAATLDELDANLREVLEMLVEDGHLDQQSEFVGTRNMRLA